jgi:hypothetical protein
MLHRQLLLLSCRLLLRRLRMLLLLLPDGQVLDDMLLQGLLLLQLGAQEVLVNPPGVCHGFKLLV